MKRTAQYCIAFVLLASLGLVSTKFSATIQNGKFEPSMEFFSASSSPILTKDWSVRGGQEGPEIEITRNREQSVLMLRNFRPNVEISEWNRSVGGDHER